VSAQSLVTMRININQEQDLTHGFRPLRCLLIIKNQEDKPIEPSRLWYTGPTYEQDVFIEVDRIEPGRSTRVPVTLTTRGYVGPEDVGNIPSHLSFALKTKDGKLIASAAGTADVAWYISALRNTFKPEDFGLPRFNILLFGTNGAGKSSFFNSVLCMSTDGRSGETCPSPVPVLNQGGHCTVKFSRLEGVDLPIAFWDTWGLTPDQYKGNELEMIMEGRLPDEWEMDNDVRLADAEDEAVAWENRPHAVIFFLAHSLLADPENDIMLKVKTEILKIKRNGINPIVLLSMIDESDESLRIDPMQKSETVDQYTKLASQVLGIGTGSVYPSINYLEDARKSFNIDRNLYRILHRALSNAKQNVEQIKKKAQLKQKSSAPLIMQQLAAAEVEAKKQRSRAVQCEELLDKEKDAIARLKTQRDEDAIQFEDKKKELKDVDNEIRTKQRRIDDLETKVQDFDLRSTPLRDSLRSLFEFALFVLLIYVAHYAPDARALLCGIPGHLLQFVTAPKAAQPATKLPPPQAPGTGPGLPMTPPPPEASGPPMTESFENVDLDQRLARDVAETRALEEQVRRHQDQLEGESNE